MKKVVFLLFTLLLVSHVSATDMEDKKLTLSFDIAEGTDSREFGFSQERIDSPDDVPVKVERIDRDGQSKQGKDKGNGKWNKH